MLHLVYGQRLDRLLSTWAERDRPGEDLELTVLTGRPQVGRWARAWWARHRGVVAGWRLSGLRAYLEERVWAAHGRRLPSTRVLSWLILDRTYAEAPLPDGLARYLDASHHPADAHRRKLQVARRLARWLDQRALGQLAPRELELWPEDVREWGRSVLDDPALIPWAEAFRDPGVLNLPARLCVLDAFEAQPALALALARVASASEVWILAANPCAEFWEDLPARRAADTLPSRSAPLLPGVEATPGENPLLLAWGAAGRRRMAELNRLSDCDFIAAFSPPTGDRRLAIVQRDLLYRQAPEGASRPEAPEPDDSISVVHAESVREEARAVAARIWAILRAEPDLRLSDVLIALPNRDAPELRSALHAALARHHGLTWQDLDVPWAERGGTVTAFRALLALGDGDFSGDAVRALLDLPHVAFDGDAEERELAQGWIRRLRVVGGRDRRALDGTYVDRDLLTWEQALRRLALGLVFDDDDRPVTNGESYVPLGTASVEAVGRFVRWIRQLLEDLSELGGRARPPAAWTAPLRALVTRHLRAVDDADERERGVLFDALEELEGVPATSELPLAVVRALIDERLDARRRDDAGAFHRGVIIAPLSRVASIPFEVCFVVGMTEESFPRGGGGGGADDSRDRFDLLQRLSATSRYFWVSAAGGEDRAPSVVWTELQDLLTRGYGASRSELEPIVVPALPERQLAWAEATGPRPPAISLPPRPPTNDVLVVARRSIFEVLWRPDRAWRREVLGLGPIRVEAPIREVFRASAQIGEEVAAEILCAWPQVDPDTLGEAVQEALQDRAASHEVPLGLYGRAEAQRLEALLRRWLEALWAEGVPARAPDAEPNRLRVARSSGGRVEVRGEPPIAVSGPNDGRTVIGVYGRRAMSADLALARSFAEHVLGNLERPRPTTALWLDARGRALRHELAPIPVDEAKRWVDAVCTDLFTTAHDVNFPFAVAREVHAARRAGREHEVPRILARARAFDPEAEQEGRATPSVDRALSWASLRFDLLERSLRR